MKKIALLLCSVFVFATSFAQTQPSTSTLPLSVIIEDLPQQFPANAKVQLFNKVNQLLTANGIGSTDAFSGFFITAFANPVSKDVVAGPPTMISQTLEISFYIADYHRKLTYATYTVTAKGIGENEGKSYLDALKRVNINSPAAKEFVATGKAKIVNYYDTEAENIFMKARQLGQQHEYEAALLELCGFPTASKAYAKSIEVGNEIYQHYVDWMAQQYLQKAKVAWMAEQNATGAEAAGEWLSQITPEATCYKDAVALYQEIKKKVLDDWKFEMKKYEDALALENRKLDIESQRVNAWKAIGVAYGRNQKPTTTYVTWLR